MLHDLTFVILGLVPRTHFSASRVGGGNAETVPTCALRGPADRIAPAARWVLGLKPRMTTEKALKVAVCWLCMTNAGRMTARLWWAVFKELHPPVGPKCFHERRSEAVFGLSYRKRDVIRRSFPA